jgi:hypothetical protein
MPCHRPPQSERMPAFLSQCHTPLVPISWRRDQPYLTSSGPSCPGLRLWRVSMNAPIVVGNLVAMAAFTSTFMNAKNAAHVIAMTAVVTGAPIVAHRRER